MLGTGIVQALPDQPDDLLDLQAMGLAPSVRRWSARQTRLIEQPNQTLAMQVCHGLHLHQQASFLGPLILRSLRAEVIPSYVDGHHVIGPHRPSPGNIRI